MHVVTASEERVVRPDRIPSSEAKKDREIVGALLEALNRIPSPEAKKDCEIVPALSEALKRIFSQETKKECEIVPALSEALKRIFSQETKKECEIVPANSPALRDEMYRIRHKVYCEELGFEPWRSDRKEHDEYDAHSLHLLIRSVQTGEFIGCTRLIRTRPEDRRCPLPFEKTCAATLDRSIVDPANPSIVDPVRFPRNTIGEVSRLAVLDRFRKRKGEEKREGDSSQNSHTPTHLHFRSILTELYLEVIRFARQERIDTLFVLTDERLARHLRFLGFNFQAIGAPIEHRGQRLPSMMDNFPFNVREFYRVLVAEAAHRLQYANPLVGLDAGAALQH